MAKFNMIAPLLSNKLGAGLEMQYQSGRKTVAGNKTSSFFITNLTLFNQDWIDGLKASISLYNLFDRTYSNPGSEEHVQDQIEQDGRSFWLKLAYTF